MYLFVYGTLRPGSSHAMSAWLSAQAAWCGEASIPGRLYRVSYYPGLVEGEGLVRGDVYALPEAGLAALLSTLDAFEGESGKEGDEYRRRLSAVTMSDGSQRQAWVYWFQQQTAGLDAVPGGDWLLV